MPLDINPNHLVIVQEILNRCLLSSDITIWVFGSRARGTAKQYSDLDIALEHNRKEKIPSSLISELVNEFEESNLPYKVDILDMNNISDNFKQIIEEDKVILTLLPPKTQHKID